MSGTKKNTSDMDSNKRTNITRRRLLQTSVAAIAMSKFLPGWQWNVFGSSMAETAYSPVSKGPLRIYGDDKYPIYYRKPLPPDAPRARYTGFRPSRTLLKQGTVRREGARPLPCDIIFERDVALKLRDGVTIYTDVFRPVTNSKCPALIAWGPYGKEVGGLQLDDLPNRAGIPRASLSELQSFEGPDPAFWVAQGYAILNPDPRGINSSEGNITFWGRQLAEDGYDFIEWAAAQEWCSGKVGMTGNSWLAISQWYIAAECPPHLAAIAPWEGLTDVFRENNLRGGIPFSQFTEMIQQTFAGKGMMEDASRMTVENQLLTPYWEDKVAKLEKITVPAYVVASYTNMLHTQGTFKGFRKITSADKWLQVHNDHEWRNYYSNQKELLSFFDYFLNEKKDNGWNHTPRVRISILNPGGKDEVNRQVEHWPPQEVDFRKLYLSEGYLRHTALNSPEIISYDANNSGNIEFIYQFKEEAEIIGYMNLHLYVEAQGSDDMELSVSVEKVAMDGSTILVHYDPTTEPKPVTASGVLRVSQRKLDPERSIPSEPWLLQLNEERLSPGEIVPVDIGLWPMALKFNPGEKLKLTIAAYKPTGIFDLGFGSAKIPVPVEGETFNPDKPADVRWLGGSPDTSPAYAKAQEVPPAPTRNKGKHIIHFGGRYDSFLLIPQMRK